jgi:hypothetical protein
VTSKARGISVKNTTAAAAAEATSSAAIAAASPDDDVMDKVQKKRCELGGTIHHTSHVKLEITRNKWNL